MKYISISLTHSLHCSKTQTKVQTPNSELWEKENSFPTARSWGIQSVQVAQGAAAGAVGWALGSGSPRQEMALIFCPSKVTCGTSQEIVLRIQMPETLLWETRGWAAKSTSKPRHLGNKHGVTAALNVQGHIWIPSVVPYKCSRTPETVFFQGTTVIPDWLHACFTDVFWLSYLYVKQTLENSKCKFLCGKFLGY